MIYAVNCAAAVDVYREPGLVMQQIFPRLLEKLIG